jgi:uncharacterized protein YbjT (DUF2867 family)
VSVVLVTGGTGTLGTHLVTILRDRGHEVRVLSRRPGAGTHVGDLRTGAGVAQAARGAEVVIHAASNVPTGRGDLTQTRTLLDAVRDARQLVYVSIVGIEAIPLGYYRQKLACEREIAGSGVPCTIQRATQFHELLAVWLRRAERLPLAPLPLGIRFQPIAAAEAAKRIAPLADGEPLGRAPDIGGPEVLELREIVTAWRARRGRPRGVVGLPLPGAVARAFREGRNTCPEHRDGRQTWAEFVASLSSRRFGRA